MPSATRRDTGIERADFVGERVHEPAHGEPDPLRGGALQFADLVCRGADIPFDCTEPFGGEFYPTLARELRERHRTDDRGIEQEHARVAVFADDPRMHAAGVHRAQACDRIGKPQRFERGARAHDRDVAAVPAPGEVFGQHVERVGDDKRDSGSAPASTELATSSMTATFCCSTSSRFSPDLV